MHVNSRSTHIEYLHYCIAELDNWIVFFFKVEDLFLTFAKKASAFNSWFENAEEDLTDPVRCNSLEEIKALREAHDAFRSSLSSAQADFNQLAELDRQIKSFRVASNPYTWFTMEALEETWRNLQKIIKASQRDSFHSLRPFKSSLEVVLQDNQYKSLSLYYRWKYLKTWEQRKNSISYKLVFKVFHLQSFKRRRTRPSLPNYKIFNVHAMQ